MHKRGRWEIYYELLEAINDFDGCKKTRAMNETHLSWNTFEPCFEFLKEKDFIEKESGEFYLSDKGEVAFDALKEFKKNI